MTPTQALAHYFAFDTFRPGQQAAIESVLSRRDTLVVMPTGSGKSLIYQLAALLLPGTALVISPLVALMQDQCDSLARRRIPATFINSSLELAEQNRRLARLSQAEYKLVLVAPERLRNSAFRRALARVPISLLAVDEAHCVSQWGHDFRPDYLHIADARQEIDSSPAQQGERLPTLALTATATSRVQDEINRLLRLAEPTRIVTGFNRPHLFFEVSHASDIRTKLERVRAFVTGIEGAGIIYTGTRRDAEELAQFAREVLRVPAAYYHAGLDAAARSSTQEAFIAGDLPLVIATNAFGMGIDRPDVRYVLHYTMPGTLEAYYQEAGRAGRDGLPARAVLIYSPQDTALHEWTIRNDAITAAELRRVHQRLERVSSITFEEIERATGLGQIKTRLALEQLQAARVVRCGELNEFGRMTIESHALAEERLTELAQQTAARQRHKKALLQRMVAYAETNHCRRRVLLDYFGDADPARVTPCCDNHAEGLGSGAQTTGTAESDAERAALVILETVAQLKVSLGRQKLAQIVKGSHAHSAKGYARAPNFGALGAWRVRDIEALITELLDLEFLKQVGGDRPVLGLTLRGESAVKTRAAIPFKRAPQPSRKIQITRAGDAAGGTIALTAQRLAAGLSPAQIAVERGLTVGTVYSHLAQLIAQRQVDVNAVVPAELQRQIRTAIEQVGSVQYLAPIRARLPSEIEYNQIRCVANAWLLETGQAPSAPPQTKPDLAVEEPELLAQLRAWRLQQARAEKAPSFMVLSDATLHQIAAQRPTSQQQLLAIRGIGQTKLEKYGAQILKLVQPFRANPGIETPGALEAPAPILAMGSDSTAPRDEVSEFLARPHARALVGPWRAGWALDAHSRFEGAEQRRSVIGDLVYRFKYNGERQLADTLAQYWVQLLAEHRETGKPSAVIPVPPSTARPFDPVTELARALARQLAIPLLAGVLIKTRQTRPQKELTSLAQKRANVAGAFGLAQPESVHGKHIVLVDDLFDSGATLGEAAQTLARGRPAQIMVLTLTKTIHTTG